MVRKRTQCMALMGRENVNNIIKKDSNYLHQIVKCILAATAHELLVNTNMVLLIIMLCSHCYIHASLLWTQACIFLKIISQWRQRPGWEELVVFSSSVDCRVSSLFLSGVRLMAGTWREVRDVAPRELLFLSSDAVRDVSSPKKCSHVKDCHVSPR